MRALLRGLGWVLNELVPAQAVRVALDRDYDRQVRKAAEAVADRDWYKARCEYLAAWISADELARVEEAKESLEPGDLSPAASAGGSGGTVRGIPSPPVPPPPPLRGLK